MITYVKRADLSTLLMVAGNEKKYSIVIDGTIKKEWVGFGWIEIGTASPADRGEYPVITDERFVNVFCSQCGADFGPGDHGFSDCRSHRRPRTPSQRTPEKT